MILPHRLYKNVFAGTLTKSGRRGMIATPKRSSDYARQKIIHSADRYGSGRITSCFPTYHSPVHQGAAFERSAAQIRLPGQG